MNYKIVSDSSSNVFSAADAAYTTVPMKINAGAKEYVDTPALNVRGMVDDLKVHKGKSGSSCSNVQEWLDAFGDADAVFGITISRNLSGSYNAASQAIRQILETEGKQAFILDSWSAGPEMAMMADKLLQCIRSGDDFETTKAKVLEYQDHCHTIFCLESMMNLARNGRVSMAVAKIAGVLGIRVVGSAQNGQIVPIQKPRGEKKALQALFDAMVERGLYDGALVRIAHCFASEQAGKLKAMVLEKYPNCRFIIEQTTALCSFYAEEGGMIIGFEGGYNQENNNQTNHAV